MVRRTFILYLLSFALSLRLAGEEPIRIAISHTQDGKPLILDSLRYELGSGEAYSVTRLSYLLSEIAFETESGQWFKAGDGVGYFDLSKRQLHYDGRLPAQTYRAMRFSLGLTPDVNHSDPAQYPARHALNPDHNQLHWTWADGYIFMALEGRFRDKENHLSGYVYHFANDENKVTVSIPLQLTHSAGALVELNFDIGHLLGFPSALSFSTDGNSTHSHTRDAVATRLKQNIPAAFQLKRVTGLVPEERQEVLKPIDLPEVFSPFAFKMSRTFPVPDLPMDNPLIEERVELGKQLFFDTRLSRTHSISCTSCHQPDRAFSDNHVQSSGVGDNPTRRHSMPLFNLAWKSEFFWDGRVSQLREQVFHPIQHPDEMNMSVEDLIEILEEDSAYQHLFARAFSPGTVTREHVGLALENYLLTLVSYQSKFDDARTGKHALTEQEQRGFELFMTEYEPRSRRYGADCFHCHGGALFTDNQYHNNGLKSGTDFGRNESTGRDSDRFKFSTPSLRNLTLTAPYMHDGSLATLEDVVRHYSEGIHPSDTLDPNLAKHPREGIQLSEPDQQALVAFLRTLTDPSFLAN